MSLLSSSFKGLKSFQKISKKVSQLDYYVANNSTLEVLKLVSLGNKTFGDNAVEPMIRELFALGARTSSQNDATYKTRKIEIKAARYWGGKDHCKWQHLEPDHDYDMVLFVLLDFTGFKVWAINKDKLMGELREKKIVTFQGKQGWWTDKGKIMPYLTEITSVEDFTKFAEDAV
jgi:hypothetical protein